MLIETNGVVRGQIEPVSAIIRQEINGEYSCDIEISARDPLAEYVQIDAIVRLEDANGTVQMFRLEKPEETLTSLKAYGWHITQDLARDMIINRAWLDQTGSNVWPELIQAGIQEDRFTGTSNIGTEASVRVVRKSVLAAAIGKDDNTFLNRFGGEIERNNFTVNMKVRLGEDRGYRVQYRKNLTGIKITEDGSAIINRVVPTFLNASDSAVLLPEIYIDSPLISHTAIPHAQNYHFDQIKVGEEDDAGHIEYPDLDSAYAAVRSMVSDMFDAGLDRPMLTVEVEFVQLRNTLEYQEYAVLEEVQLGDTIRADYEKHTIINRVVKYEWDAVLKKYRNITLGTVRPSIDAMTASIQTNVTQSVKSAVSQRLVSSLISELVKLNEHVNGAMGYYSTTITAADGSKQTYLHDEEDLEDSLFISYVPEPGTYVWTDAGWNEGDPDWTYGFTQAGSAVMRLVTTVGLNADWIKAGKVAAQYLKIGSGSEFDSGYDPTKLTYGQRNYLLLSGVAVDFGEQGDIATSVQDFEGRNLISGKHTIPGTTWESIQNNTWQEWIDL